MCSPCPLATIGGTLLRGGTIGKGSEKNKREGRSMEERGGEKHRREGRGKTTCI